MPDLMAPRGRYAPSPSGTLHLGNLRTALLAWLFAHCMGGQCVLRIEDLDRPRVYPGATEQILADLSWLGLRWGEGPENGGPFAPYIQSERLDLYEHALQQLQDAGMVYPCYCSRAEIAQVASAPQQGDEQGVRYPGTCRTLTTAQKRQFIAQKRRPALRFRVPDERTVTFIDQVAGPTEQQVQQTVGDFVIRRADGIFAYQFAVVVDDGLMEINQIVRGIDLLSSTARQILLFEALGFPIPTFAHVPLLLDEQGRRQAKRILSAGLAPERAAGRTPEQVIGRLAFSCGLIERDYATSLNELVARYALNSYAIMRAQLQGQL